MMYRQIIPLEEDRTVRLTDFISYEHEHISFNNELVAKAGGILSSKRWQSLAFSAILWYPINGASRKYKGQLVFVVHLHTI